MSFALNLSALYVSQFVSCCSLQDLTKTVNEDAGLQRIYWSEGKTTPKPPLVKPPQGDACAMARRTNSRMENCEQSHFVVEPKEKEKERMRETDGWKSCEAWGTFCWLEQEEVTESLMWLEAAWGRWHIQGNVLAHPSAATVFIPGSLYGAAGAGEVERGRLARTVCTLGGTSRVPLGVRYPTDGSAWLMPFKSARGRGPCNQLCRDVEMCRELTMILPTVSWTIEGTLEGQPV